MDHEGHYINNKAFLIPTGDYFLLAVLTSPLIWWFLWRFLPPMKDEALSPVAFLMESFPVASPSKGTRATIEEYVARLINLCQSFAQQRASFLQWVSHKTGITNVPTALESPWRLRPEEFLSALKKAGLKHSSPAVLQHLTQTFETESASLRANRIEALQLERQLDELILKLYKLTPDEITLLRQTAPPRSPLTVLSENLTNFHTSTPRKA